MLSVKWTCISGSVSSAELDEIRQFGYTQLGFVMMLNWNVSIEPVQRQEQQQPQQQQPQKHQQPGSTVSVRSSW